VGLVRDWSVGEGRAARCEELAKTRERRVGKLGGRSVTTRMPREEGPNAERRVEKGTVLDWRAERETVTGLPVLGALDGGEAIGRLTGFGYGLVVPKLGSFLICNTTSIKTCDEERWIFLWPFGILSDHGV